MMDKLFKKIIEANSEQEIMERVDDLKGDYVWDWEDEFDDIDEAYWETGRGQAESAALNAVITEATTDKIDDDLYCNLFDALAEHWGLSTD